MSLTNSLPAPGLPLPGATRKSSFHEISPHSKVSGLPWRDEKGLLEFFSTVMEGVFLNRTDQGLKPRFVKGEPPSDADVADVIQKISHRVIRKLRQLGYLEAGMQVPVATGYDPLLDNEPELARTP
jgi:hypothetical protein